MKIAASNHKMPKKAPAHKPNEPLDTKALRSTKDKFIFKDEAQKVSGEQETPNWARKQKNTKER